LRGRWQGEKEVLTPGRHSEGSGEGICLGPHTTNITNATYQSQEPNDDVAEKTMQCHTLYTSV